MRKFIFVFIVFLTLPATSQTLKQSLVVNGAQATTPGQGVIIPAGTYTIDNTSTINFNLNDTSVTFLPGVSIISTADGCAITVSGSRVTVLGYPKIELQTDSATARAFCVTAGAQQTIRLGQLSRQEEDVVISKVARSVTDTATITTATNHNLAVGEQVRVDLTTPTSFEGNFAVASVPTATTFTYSQPDTSGTVNTISATKQVNWISGDKFNTTGNMTGENITINSVSYEIATVDTDKTLTLISDPGDQSTVSYSFSFPTYGEMPSTGKAYQGPITGQYGFHADTGAGLGALLMDVQVTGCRRLDYCALYEGGGGGSNFDIRATNGGNVWINTVMEFRDTGQSTFNVAISSGSALKGIVFTGNGTGAAGNRGQLYYEFDDATGGTAVTFAQEARNNFVIAAVAAAATKIDASGTGDDNVVYDAYRGAFASADDGIALGGLSAKEQVFLDTSDFTGAQTLKFPNQTGTFVASNGSINEANAFWGINNGLRFEGSSTESPNIVTDLVVANPTSSNKTVTIPNLTGTLALLENNQTFSGDMTFSGDTTHTGDITLSNAHLQSVAVSHSGSCDTTPIVSGSNVFIFNYTGSPATCDVTDFESGVNGQWIFLLFQNQVVELIDGSTLELAGDTDFQSSAKDTMLLVRISSVWYEVSRSVN